MFAHPPELALPTCRFEPSGMVEQYLETDIKWRYPWFGPILGPMLLQDKSRLLFLPKEPGSSKRGSSY
jgi:hypothetical protein